SRTACLAPPLLDQETPVEDGVESPDDRDHLGVGPDDLESLFDLLLRRERWIDHEAPLEELAAVDRVPALDRRRLRVVVEDVDPPGDLPAGRLDRVVPVMQEPDGAGTLGDCRTQTCGPERR